MLGELALHRSSTEPGRPPSERRGQKYVPPSAIQEWHLSDLLALARRPIEDDQKSLFSRPEERDPIVFCAGEVELLRKPCVSVIGARSVSEEGRARASRVARELVRAGLVVTSGLAKGVDAAAHNAAIDAGGRTIAVIGTPIDKVYPAENAQLQEAIYTNHLLVSQFRRGQRTFQSDFPKRNRLMAALSDGSVIVEASDTSGTLHQAAECLRLGRWLFIMRSVVENPKLTWPARFLNNPRTVVLNGIEDILSRV